MKRFALLIALLLLAAGVAHGESKPYEEHLLVDQEYGRTKSSFAQWDDAGLDVALEIFQGLGITPRLPTVFPEGFDPEAEPLVNILISRDHQNFAEYRTGEMLSSEILDGVVHEYWPLDPALFEQPDEIRIYYYNEAKDAYFGLLCRLLSPWQLTMSGHASGVVKEQFDNGMLCMNAFEQEGEATQGYYHWRQVYLLEGADVESIAGSNLDKESLMVAYEVMSSDIDLDVLMDVGRGLQPLPRYGMEDYFTYMHDPRPLPEALAAGITPLNAIVTADESKITVTGAAFDGEVLIVTYVVENLTTEKDAWRQIDLDVASLDGETIIFNNADGVMGQDMLLPRPVKLQEQWASQATLSDTALGGSMNGFLQERVTEDTATVTLEFVISEPTGPLVLVSDLPMPEQEEMVAASGISVAPEDDQDIDAWVARGYVPIEPWGSVTEGAEGTCYTGWRCMRPGLMDEVERVSVTFDVSRMAEEEHYTAGDVSLAFGGWTIHSANLMSTPLMTYVDTTYTRTDDVPLEGSVHIGSNRLCERLVDAEGMACAVLPMGWGSDSWNSDVIFDEETLTVTARSVMPGTYEAPVALVLAEDFLWLNEESAAPYVEKGEAVILPLTRQEEAK